MGRGRVWMLLMRELMRGLWVIMRLLFDTFVKEGGFMTKYSGRRIDIRCGDVYIFVGALVIYIIEI